MNKRKILKISCFLLCNLQIRGFVWHMDRVQIMVWAYRMTVQVCPHTALPPPIPSQSYPSNSLFHHLAAPASCLSPPQPVLCLTFLIGQLGYNLWPDLWLKAVALCTPLCLEPSAFIQHLLGGSAKGSRVRLCRVVHLFNYFKANSYNFNNVNYNTSNLCRALQFTKHFYVLSFKKNCL